MTFNDKHMLHGAALLQIIEHGTFTALNKYGDLYGHYHINNDISILTKFARLRSDGRYQFTIKPEDKHTLKQESSSRNCFACLICGDRVCTLGFNELEQVVDLDDESNATIRVQCNPNSPMYISGPGGIDLPYTIGASSFPSKIFE